jgi:ABC-type transport system substrate-binding protein
VPGDADERQTQLTQMRLFEIDRIRNGTAYYRTRFFDEWEPRDLGRKMRFTLRHFRQPFELQSTVYAADVVAPLLQRLDPNHPAYDERLAAILESIDVASPQEFTLTFRRVPPRLEPLLARVALIEPDPSLAAEATLTDPGGFRIAGQMPDQVCYVRKLAEPDGLPRYHIAEIVEHRYESAEKVVRALELGEISMAPNLPDAIIRRLQADHDFQKRFFIQQYQQPVSHLLQFNPASVPLRIPELRKALAYAVERERLLQEIVLEDPAAHHGRLVTTPFLSSNPGRNVLVKPLRSDFSAAIALALAARQKLKGKIPPLTMVVAPGTIPERVAEELARAWRKVGLTIQVVHDDDPSPPHWDILYRTLQMNEPLLEIWPFLTLEDRAKIQSLDVYPDWLKQEMVQLDRTSDQALAVELLQKLHHHLAESMTYVPLWEVDRFLVFRKTIQGFPQHPMHCYDEVDHWVLEPWYRTELP